MPSSLVYIENAVTACCMEEEEAKVAPSPAVSQATRTESGRPKIGTVKRLGVRW